MLAIGNLDAQRLRRVALQRHHQIVDASPQPPDPERALAALGLARLHDGGMHDE